MRIGVADPLEWHRWFAWRPVRVGFNGKGARYWLQKLERKRIGLMWFEYRLPEQLSESGCR